MSSKYLNQISSGDERYLDNYPEFEQYARLECDGLEILIGSLLKLKDDFVFNLAADKLNLGRPSFGQVYRILKTRKRGPVILVLFYHLANKKIAKLPALRSPDYPNLTDKDVLCDSRTTPVYGIISRNNIAQVTSMVRTNYMDEPMRRLKETKTSYCYRFTIKESNGKTVLLPYHKENKPFDVYSNDKLKAALLLKEGSKQPPVSLKASKLRVISDDEVELPKRSKSSRLPVKQKEVVTQRVPSPLRKESEKKKKKEAEKLKLPDHPALTQAPKRKMFSQTPASDESVVGDHSERDEEVSRLQHKSVAKKVHFSAKAVAGKASKENASKVLTIRPKSILEAAKEVESEEEDTQPFAISKTATQAAKTAAYMQRQENINDEDTDVFGFNEPKANPEQTEAHNSSSFSPIAGPSKSRSTSRQTDDNDAETNKVDSSSDDELFSPSKKASQKQLISTQTLDSSSDEDLFPSLKRATPKKVAPTRRFDLSSTDGMPSHSKNAASEKSKKEKMPRTISLDSSSSDELFSPSKKVTPKKSSKKISQTRQDSSSSSDELFSSSKNATPKNRNISRLGKVVASVHGKDSDSDEKGEGAEEKQNTSSLSKDKGKANINPSKSLEVDKKSGGRKDQNKSLQMESDDDEDELFPSSSRRKSTPAQKTVNQQDLSDSENAGSAKKANIPLQKRTSPQKSPAKKTNFSQDPEGTKVFASQEPKKSALSLSNESEDEGLFNLTKKPEKKIQRPIVRKRKPVFEIMDEDSDSGELGDQAQLSTKVSLQAKDQQKSNDDDQKLEPGKRVSRRSIQSEKQSDVPLKGVKTLLGLYNKSPEEKNAVDPKRRASVKLLRDLMGIQDVDSDKEQSGKEMEIEEYSSVDSLTSTAPRTKKKIFITEHRAGSSTKSPSSSATKATSDEDVFNTPCASLAGDEESQPLKELPGSKNNSGKGNSYSMFSSVADSIRAMAKSRGGVKKSKLAGIVIPGATNGSKEDFFLDTLDFDSNVIATVEEVEANFNSGLASKENKDSEVAQAPVEQSGDTISEGSQNSSVSGMPMKKPRTPKKKKVDYDDEMDFIPQRNTRKTAAKKASEIIFTLDTYLGRNKPTPPIGTRSQGLTTSPSLEMDRLQSQCIESILTNEVLRAGDYDEVAKPVPSKEIPHEEEALEIAEFKSKPSSNKKLSLVLTRVEAGENTASEVEDSDSEAEEVFSPNKKVLPTILRLKKDTPLKPDEILAALPVLPSSPVSSKKPRKEKLVVKEDDQIRINGKKATLKHLVASPAKDGSLKMRIRSPDKKKTESSFQDRMKAAESSEMKMEEVPVASPRGRGRPKSAASPLPKPLKITESPLKKEVKVEVVASPRGRGRPKSAASSMAKPVLVIDKSPQKLEAAVASPRGPGRPPRSASSPLIKTAKVVTSPLKITSGEVQAADSPRRPKSAASPKVAGSSTPGKRSRPPRSASSPLIKTAEVVTSPLKNASGEVAVDSPRRPGRPPKSAASPKVAGSSTPGKRGPKVASQDSPKKKTPSRGRRSLQLSTPTKSPARRRISVAPRMETVDEENNAKKICLEPQGLKTPERRGRPRKIVTPKRYQESSSEEDSPPVAKKRGRPAFKTSIETPRVGRGRPRKDGTTPSKNYVSGTPKRTPGRSRRLHVEESNLEERKMPGREEQMANIQDFIESRLEDKSGGCMYISGLPGTGKTASVTQVMRNLLKLRDDGGYDFKLIQVSGMELTQPQQVFCRMAEILLESRMTPAIAQSSLTKYFSNKDKKRTSTILVIDELDMLCTKKQDVVYHLFDWPTKASARLIVLTIANTMDLPERLLQGKVTSRMGLTRLTFRPYTYDQLEKIVQVKLGESGDFDRDARQLVARKVASLSGDARRALEICRRALELVAEEKGGAVQMTHVMKALKEMLESPIIEAIKNLSPLEKLFLECISSEIQRTGVEETTLGEVLKAMRASGIYHGVTDFTNSKISEICARLASSRLVLAEQDRAGLKQRISLNVNTDDMHYALKISGDV